MDHHNTLSYSLILLILSSFHSHRVCLVDSPHHLLSSPLLLTCLYSYFLSILSLFLLFFHSTNISDFGYSYWSPPFHYALKVLSWQSILLLPHDGETISSIIYRILNFYLPIFLPDNLNPITL